MSEDMELKKISRPNWGEVTRGGRRWHSEDFHISCSSLNVNRMIISLRMKWAWRLVCIAERRDAHKVLMWKCERKRQRERPRRKWEKILNACLRNKIWAWTVLIWFREGTNLGFLSTR
jgi:hypothetical protein